MLSDIKILRAIVDDDSDTIEFVLDANETYNLSIDVSVVKEPPPMLQNGTPLIDIAIILDSKKCIRSLLKHEENIEIEDAKGRKPVHFCAAFNNIDALTLLQKKGADIKSKDKRKRGCIHYAAFYGKINIVEWLLSAGVDPNSMDKYKNTPLLLACKGNELDIARLLVIKGAKQTPNKDGWTCIHFAVKNDNYRLLDFLLKNTKDIDIKNKLGETPLHWAASTNNMEMVEALVNNGANVNNVTSELMTPLMFACQQGNLEMAKFLINNRAITRFTDDNLQGPLHFAVMSRNVGLVKYLIAQKCQVNEKTKDFNTPLHLAARVNSPEICIALIKAGADKRVRDANKFTPRMVARALGNQEALDAMKTYCEKLAEKEGFVWRNGKKVYPHVIY